MFRIATFAAVTLLVRPGTEAAALERQPQCKPAPPAWTQLLPEGAALRFRTWDRRDPPAPGDGPVDVWAVVYDHLGVSPGYISGEMTVAWEPGVEAWWNDAGELVLGSDGAPGRPRWATVAVNGTPAFEVEVPVRRSR